MAVPEETFTHSTHEEEEEAFAQTTMPTAWELIPYMVL